jgi:hypothetical protein
MESQWIMLCLVLGFGFGGWMMEADDDDGQLWRSYLRLRLIRGGGRRRELTMAAAIPVGITEGIKGG